MAALDQAARVEQLGAKVKQRHLAAVRIERRHQPRPFDTRPEEDSAPPARGRPGSLVGAAAGRAPAGRERVEDAMSTAVASPEEAL
jgi:hypothetical protein